MSRRKRAASSEPSQESSGRLLGGAARFVGVEKNLASLGFFSPSSTRGQGERKKEVTFIRIASGQKTVSKVTILPAVTYGLPITADQDKWLALQVIIGEQRRRTGKIENPIEFTSVEMFHLLGITKCGSSYAEVSEWITRMIATTVISEGTVYLAEKKTHYDKGKKFHVFEKAEFENTGRADGTRSDYHSVWLSDWQLENIRNNYLLPVDFERYKVLKNHIAKALVLHLQVWTYASSRRGVFEKSYDELCQLLNVTRNKWASDIRKQLRPSLDELKSHAFIQQWEIEPSADGSYKLVFYHSARTQPDGVSERTFPVVEVGSKNQVEADPDQPSLAFDPEPPSPEVDEVLLNGLTKRGIARSQAVRLLTESDPGQPIQDQLEWGDHVVSQGGIGNPPGFFVSLIRDRVIPPDSFETSSIRNAREAREKAQREASEAESMLCIEYERYCRNAVDSYVSANPEECERLRQEKRREFRSSRPGFTDSGIESAAAAAMRHEVENRLSLSTFNQFCEMNSAGGPLVDPSISETLSEGVWANGD